MPEKKKTKRKWIKERRASWDAAERVFGLESPFDVFVDVAAVDFTGFGFDGCVGDEFFLLKWRVSGR
jgi:hypothetical protein